MKRAAAAILLFAMVAEGATRVKELASIEGVRDNQLIGYGLVVGLAGTGDRRQAVFSAQSLTNLLQRMGVSVSPTAIQVSNTAAVMITATLPPFAQPGARLDVTAAAVGDAKTLQGGLLLLTPLKGADGQVYAAAQGSVVTGGFSAGGSGASQTLNHPTAGRVPGGGIIERSAPTPALSSKIRLQLRQADFTTAAHIAAAINKKFGADGGKVATAESSGSVAVQAPTSYAAKQVEFISEMEALTVETDRLAKIVINERTGTIAMGKEVKIAPVAILHGSLTVEIENNLLVSQPEALSGGQTAVVPKATVAVKEEKARNISLKNGASVDELVRALMAIGSTPRDIIAILQSLKAAGALEAELEII
ncbi:MAG: flagellar basal body P-ring protein FlgI [Bryobacteraceae bacterium]